MKSQMGENCLTKIFSLLSEKDNDRKKCFSEYFSNAPGYLIDSMEILELNKEVYFIKEGERANNILFLVKGIVEAIDLRVHGEMFNYKHFREVYAFGGMEVILDIDNYMTTLKTNTKCIFVKIPRKVFEKWIYSNPNALKREAKMVARNLLDEGRNERLLLFIQGADRLTFLIIKRYEYYNVRGVLSLDYDRQKIADATGMSTKTISRAIKYLEENELITRENNTIKIDAEQYKKMKDIISDRLEL